MFIKIYYFYFLIFKYELQTKCRLFKTKKVIFVTQVLMWNTYAK